MKTLRATLALTVIAAAAALSSASASAQGMRPEVGKPLQQAGDFLRQGKAREALAKVREAEGVAGITGAERATIDRMKAAAAQRAGDFPTAIAALEGTASRASGAELGSVAEQLAAAYVQTRNNAKANEWLQKAVAAGNTSPTVRQMQQYLQSTSGDYSAIAKAAAAEVQAAEQAGRRPAEDDLLRLADAQQRMSNTNGYVATLEKLLFSYPKKDYWSAYLGRLPRKAGFSPRYELDVLRLRLATGGLAKADEYMEMAQLSLQQGMATESRRIIEQGYKSGVLGTGAEAGRHQRLRDLINTREAAAKTSLGQQASEAAAEGSGDSLVRVGMITANVGSADEGIKLIEQGIAKGKLSRPDEARLRLGLAQLAQAKTRNAGLATLRTVKGTDGSGDIARLWLIAPAPTGG
jgi:peptidoglycan hydrolase-like protein with peptidoglycan-binding domain